MYTKYNDKFPNSFQEINKRFTQGAYWREYKPDYEYAIEYKTVPDMGYFYSRPNSLMLDQLHHNTLDTLHVYDYIRGDERHRFSYRRFLRL